MTLPSARVSGRTIGDVKNDGSRRQLPSQRASSVAQGQRGGAEEGPAGVAGVLGQRGQPRVTTPTGRPVSDRNLATRDFADICEKAGVGTWHLHEMRHTAATLALADRVPIEVVAKILGHRSIRQTANTYAHLLPRQLEDTVAVIDRGL